MSPGNIKNSEMLLVESEEDLGIVLFLYELKKKCIIMIKMPLLREIWPQHISVTKQIYVIWSKR